ncbi:hypothetical protein [Altererythrobacter sp.]|uniref:hypothetical protein n=1 Tax=Altererythrobacter sp. TaxID=1872480 RepID=UPI003CFE45DA
MRRRAIMMATVILAACSGGPAEDSADTGTETAMTLANGSPAGTYYVAAADGTASLVTVNADGTYSQVTPEGTDAAQGTFEVVDGKTCFKTRSVGAVPICYSETEPAEDGSYTATPDGGEPLSVKPYTAADAAPTD